MDTKGADGGKLATVLAITPGQDQNAAVVRPGHRRPSYNLTKMSDLAAVQDELALGPAAGLRQEPALQGRPRAVRHHLPAQAAHRAGGLRRAHRRSAQGQRHRLRLALLDPAGHPGQRLHAARGRPQDPAGRQRRAARPRGLPGQGRRRRLRGPARRRVGEDDDRRAAYGSASRSRSTTTTWPTSPRSGSRRTACSPASRSSDHAISGRPARRRAGLFTSPESMLSCRS